MRLRKINSIHDLSPGMIVQGTHYRYGNISETQRYLILSWDWTNDDVSYLHESGTIQRLVRMYDGLYDGMFKDKQEMISTYEQIIISHWKIIESFEE